MKLLNYKTLPLPFHIFGLSVGFALVFMRIGVFYWNYQPHYLSSKATLSLNDKVIDLEVAREPDELVHGLKFRRQIAPNHGMLFVNPRPSTVELWMKDTYVPLDLIFLHNGSIKNIITNVPPCQQSKCPIYSSGGVVDQVVEIGANQASLLGLKVEEQVKIVENSH